MPGDGRNVDADLAKAADAGGAETFGQLFSVAAANALARRTAQAGEAASKAAAAANNDGQRRAARIVTGMAALLENDAAHAMQELSQADPTNSMTRVLMAEAQEKLGHVSEARALRDGVLNGNTVGFMDAVARARAKSGK
jgi:predicted Zn-dependent protease